MQAGRWHARLDQTLFLCFLKIALTEASSRCHSVAAPPALLPETPVQRASRSTFTRFRPARASAMARRSTSCRRSASAERTGRPRQRLFQRIRRRHCLRGPGRIAGGAGRREVLGGRLRQGLLHRQMASAPTFPGVKRFFRLLQMLWQPKPLCRISRSACRASSRGG